MILLRVILEETEKRDREKGYLPALSYTLSHPPPRLEFWSDPLYDENPVQFISS